uniref:thrombospondin-3-like n=1 Tax=Pristiophorus japonicus TaxID=55135 RepID=UPI00398F4E01
MDWGRGDRRFTLYFGYLVILSAVTTQPCSREHTLMRNHDCIDAADCERDGPDVIRECGANTECYNTQFRIHCNCKDGYTSSTGQMFFDTRTDCVDINECADGDELCGPNESCHNTEGTYICSCKQGFESSGEMHSSDLTQTRCLEIPSAVHPRLREREAPDNGNTSEPDNGNTSVPDNGNTSVPDNGNMSVPDNGTTTEPDNATTSMPDNGNTTEPDNGNTTEPDNGTTSVPDNGNTTEPDNGNMSMPDNATMSMPDNAATSMPDNGTTSMPNNGNTMEPDNVTTSMPDNGTTSMPDNRNTTEPDNGTMSVPDNGDTSVPDNGDTTEPDNGTMSMPGNRDTLVPDNGDTTEPDNGTTSMPGNRDTSVPDNGDTTELDDGTTSMPASAPSPGPAADVPGHNDSAVGQLDTSRSATPEQPALPGGLFCSMMTNASRLGDKLCHKTAGVLPTEDVILLMAQLLTDDSPLKNMGLKERLQSASEILQAVERAAIAVALNSAGQRLTDITSKEMDLQLRVIPVNSSPAGDRVRLQAKGEAMELSWRTVSGSKMTVAPKNQEQIMAKLGAIERKRFATVNVDSLEAETGEIIMGNKEMAEK